MVVFGFQGNQRLSAPVLYGQLEDFDMFVFWRQNVLLTKLLRAIQCT